MILKGNDALEKANKMMESLNVSQKVDTFSNVEKVVSAYNGKRYGIVKEGTKYIIKEAVVKNAKMPSDFDYIDGVQNKAKYSKNTLTEAEKTLNLWNIEFSRVYGTSLVNEEEMPEDEMGTKKTVLKVPVKKSEAAPMEDMPAEVPAEMPADMGAEMPEMPEMPSEEMPAEEAPEASEEGEDSEEGVDPKKSIQKLAGKLAYELREFEGEDDDYSDIYKFAASMVASAADADKISDEDRKSIINKVEKNLTPSEDEEGSEEMPEETEEEMPETEEGEEGSEESAEETLAEAFKRIQEAKKKLSAKQEKFLDVYEDDKDEITAKDFEMLRKSKNEEVEKPVSEGLEGKPINVWIKDFVNSKNPKFKGKSKKKRREMAIAAFLESERSQGKDTSITVMKGKKGKKSLKEGSDYMASMDEDYMMAEEDDFYFEEGKKEKLLLDKEYMDEAYMDEDYTMEGYMDEDYMSEVAAMGEKDYSLYEEEEDEDIYFEMDYSQKKK
jgi:hypothetical protein